MHEPASRAPRQIVGLDFLRAAAALFVVVFHLGFWIWNKASDPRAVMPTAYVRFTPLFSVGWVGVEIFFVLSGFVIAYSTTGTTPWGFVQRRAFRLLPTALICATITGALLLTAYPLAEVAALWARSVTFWPVGPWVDGQYWTLPIEVAFYAVVFLVLFSGRANSFSAVMSFVGLASAGSCALATLWRGQLPVVFSNLLGASARPPVGCALFLYGCYFALGCFLYLLLVQGVTAFRIAAAALSGCGCICQILHESGFALGSTPSMATWSPLCVWLLAMVYLVTSVRMNTQFAAALGRRGTLIARQVGLATYPLYLLHNKLGQVAIGGLHRRTGYGMALVLAIAFVLVLALLVALWIEPALRRGLERAWTKPHRTLLEKRG